MGVEIVGLREFVSALKRVGPEWPKALREVLGIIAEEGRDQSRRRAKGMGGVQSKAAGAIGKRATNKGASVTVATGSALGGVAFFGAKRHAGWYSRARYSNSTPQFDPWVGSSWEVAVAGEGPYAINDALAAYLPYLDQHFQEMIDELASAAFPGR